MATAEKKRQVELDTARREAVALQEKFKSDYRVEAWVNQTNLAANPFVYKDKVVGLRAEFHQMLADGEASFGWVVATGVSNTLFSRPGIPLMLAVRISGMKAIKTPIGFEVPMPYGKLVGCAEFVGP